MPALPTLGVSQTPSYLSVSFLYSFSQAATELPTGSSLNLVVFLTFSHLCFLLLFLDKVMKIHLLSKSINHTILYCCPWA